MFNEVTCPYKLCGNKFIPKAKDLVNFAYGKYYICPKCGGRIAFIKYVDPKRKVPKEHMSKKERLARRRGDK